MAFDLLAKDRALDYFPRGLELSHLTSLLNRKDRIETPEMRWRWEVLEIAYEAMLFCQSNRGKSSESIWKHEARLRTANFLQLALLDSQIDAPTRTGRACSVWQARSVRNLAKTYKILAESKNSETIDCEPILRSLVTNLISAYEPVVKISDSAVIITPLRLRPPRRIAFVLSTGMLLQGFLKRAAAIGGAARLQVELLQVDNRTHCLMINVSETPFVTLASDSFRMASRLLGILQADFTCIAPSASGAIIKITFENDSAVHSGQ